MDKERDYRLKLSTDLKEFFVEANFCIGVF